MGRMCIPMQYSAYEVADILYQGSLTNNQNSHEYLYTNILSIVNQGYSKIDYKGTAYISAGNK